MPSGKPIFDHPTFREVDNSAPLVIETSVEVNALPRRGTRLLAGNRFLHVAHPKNDAGNTYSHPESLSHRNTIAK